MQKVCHSGVAPQANKPQNGSSFMSQHDDDDDDVAVDDNVDAADGGA